MLTIFIWKPYQLRNNTRLLITKEGLVNIRHSGSSVLLSNMFPLNMLEGKVVLLTLAA